MVVTPATGPVTILPEKLAFAVIINRTLLLNYCSTIHYSDFLQREAFSGLHKSFMFGIFSILSIRVEF